MVARIDERTKNFSEASDRQHRDMSEKLDKLASKESVAAVSDRVSVLEKEATWVKRSAIGALILAVGSVVKQHFGA